MYFSGRSHGVYKFTERSLYQFASNAKPLDTLTHLNLGFIIVTSVLEYVCQTREYPSTIAKFVVSATFFVSIIAYQLINKTQKCIFTFLCFAMVSLMQNKEHKYSLNVKLPHLGHIFHQCTKSYLYKRYLQLYTKYLDK